MLPELLADFQSLTNNQILCLTNSEIDANLSTAGILPATGVTHKSEICCKIGLPELIAVEVKVRKFINRG